MLIAVAVFRDVPDAEQLLLVTARLLAAALLGGIVGFERQREGKSAGVRTHMLVALGAAAFTVIPIVAGADDQGVSRVIQGVAAGVGFLGAGIILPLREKHKVQGLTTAANIWVTAAAGVAAGAGFLWVAAATVGVAWIILDTVHRLEHRLRGDKQAPPAGDGASKAG